MPKRYKLFLIVQLFHSVFTFVWTFITGRSSTDKAPESFFILGAIVMGTMLFIALQPLLKRPETTSKTGVVLVIGYILVFTASRELFKDRTSLFAVCCLVLSMAGIAMYAVTDKGLSAHLSHKTGARIVFFLLLIVSLVCNVGGNIALICSFESTLPEIIMNVMMILIVITASGFLVFSKNHSAGKLHLCAVVISGIALEKPFSYIVLFLIAMELLSLTNRFGIYTSR